MSFSDVISAQPLANFELLMQKLPVFSMCTQDGNCVYITPSTVGGKTVHRWENFRTVFGGTSVGEGLFYNGFVHVAEISCFNLPPKIVSS